MEKKQNLKRRGQSRSSGGCLKKEGRGVGTLLRTKADLPQLVYEEICSNFALKYTVHFWVELKKIANSD